MKIHAFRNLYSIYMNVVKPLFPCPPHIQIIDTYIVHTISKYALSKSSPKISCHLRIQQITFTIIYYLLGIIRLEISGLTLVPSGFRANQVLCSFQALFNWPQNISVISLFYIICDLLCHSVFSLDFGKLIFRFDQIELRYSFPFTSSLPFSHFHNQAFCSRNFGANSNQFSCF